MVTEVKRTSKANRMNGTNMDVFEIKQIFNTSMSDKNNYEISSASGSYIDTLKQTLILMSFLLSQKWQNLVRESHEILLIRYVISTHFLIFYGNR